MYHWRCKRREQLVFCPYLRRLECLTICRCNYKGSTFSSVILPLTLSVGTVWGLNPRPPAQQSGAFPIELTRWWPLDLLFVCSPAWGVGGTPKKIEEGCATCFPKPLPYLWTRLSLPYLWPDQKFDTLFMTWPLNQYPVSNQFKTPGAWHMTGVCHKPLQHVTVVVHIICGGLLLLALSNAGVKQGREGKAGMEGEGNDE